MLEATLLRLIDAGGEADASTEATAEAAAVPSRGVPGDGRRAFMAGRAGPGGGWAWVAPDSEEARRFLPGPFSLALVIARAGRPGPQGASGRSLTPRRAGDSRS